MNENQNNKQENLFSGAKSDFDSAGDPGIKIIHHIKERENPYIIGSD